MKECGLQPDQIGVIDVKDHFALAAVRTDRIGELLQKMKGAKIKGERRQVSVIK